MRNLGAGRRRSCAGTAAFVALLVTLTVSPASGQASLQVPMQFDFLNPGARSLAVGSAGNGSAGPLGTRAFARLGMKPVELFCDMDGRFPNHHPDPTVPKNLEQLIAESTPSIQPAAPPGPVPTTAANADLDDLSDEDAERLLAEELER